METIEQSAPAAAEPLARRGDPFSRREDADDFELGFSAKSKSVWSGGSDTVPRGTEGDCDSVCVCSIVAVFM